MTELCPNVFCFFNKTETLSTTWDVNRMPVVTFLCYWSDLKGTSYANFQLNIFNSGTQLVNGLHLHLDCFSTLEVLNVLYNDYSRK